MSLPVLGIIPARIGSSRLPRKPLHPLAGRPLIEWVWRGVMAMDLLDEVVVATDSEEVAEAVRAFGGRAEMTAEGHPSGTDRVAEVAHRAEFAGYPVVLNVQGDEPFLRRGQVEAALACVRGGGWEIGTAAVPISSVEEWREPSVVKVVRGADGGALLFSRAPVPFRRDGEPGPEELASGLYLRHLGIYAYRREALLRWVALPEGELERVEKLEQLRPLAAGMRIGVGIAEPGPGGIDTPEDAERAGRLLRGMDLTERLPGAARASA